MTAAEVRASFEALDPDRRARCLALLCDENGARLRQYFSDRRATTYEDSVVGLRHELDVELPFRALEAIRSARGVPPASVLDALLAEYGEPMTAHQDGDLVFTNDRAQYAYLAIYNLVESCRAPDDRELAWLVVRQALSASGPDHPTSGDVDKLLARWVSNWARDNRP